jgi:hypothetical protein
MTRRWSADDVATLASVLRTALGQRANMRGRGWYRLGQTLVMPPVHDDLHNAGRATIESVYGLTRRMSDKWLLTGITLCTDEGWGLH